MSRYTSTTPEDLRAMLAAIGVGSLEELFERQVPAGVRLGRALDLPAGLPEQDVYAHLRELAARNVSAEDEITFLGAGMYDHYVPAVVDMLMERSEYLTPYTPYQPEVSQGGLQVMFEYQTAISELTALPVSNASVYEGPSAVAAAAYLARIANGKGRVVVSRAVHPHSRETLRTTAAGYGVEVVEVGLRDGVTDLDAWADAIDQDTSAVIFQNPNFLGAVEDAAALAEAAKDSPAVVVGAYDPIPLGILRPPGECGVDVAVGEGQSLGNRLDFGGPSFGFFAATEAYLRRMPGRIAGETRDVDGRRGFVLTLQTREQHIRREKATSNICTAQALNALGGRRVPELARPPRARRARRAAAAAHPLRARGADGARRRRGAARAAGRARVRGDASTWAGGMRFRRDRALRGRGRRLRLAARRRLPGVRARPARGDHRAALAGRHRPARRGPRRGGRGRARRTGPAGVAS